MLCELHFLCFVTCFDEKPTLVNLTGKQGYFKSINSGHKPHILYGGNAYKNIPLLTAFLGKQPITIIEEIYWSISDNGLTSLWLELFRNNEILPVRHDDRMRCHRMFLVYN